jgi:non-canonical (house-cleaning) NTP pyrophosphatase
MKDLANELIIGLVTGVGSNNNAIIQALKEAFKAVCYEECHIIECKISNLFTSENFNKIQDKEIDGKINSIREKLKITIL